jgi:exopolyphosphatase/guanosine-5'-triphosphate,3'-diphosphate pyrophosphatase
VVQAPKGRKRRHPYSRRKQRGETRGASDHGRGPVLAAIDVGTNACRLLVAVPSTGEGPSMPKVIDSYTASVRLGEGLERKGIITEGALNRTIKALKICADRMKRHRVTHVRAIATETCRRATNASALIERAREETGIELIVVSPEEEARLAAEGCLPLIGEDFEGALIFDIGGGSTELILVRRAGADAAQPFEIVSWASVPVGVVRLAERHGGTNLPASAFQPMRQAVRNMLDEVRGTLGSDIFDPIHFHLLGTSGTLTTLAGIKLGLSRYVRSRIDGHWLTRGEVLRITERIVREDFAGRADIPCIGNDRADLILPGCAILSAIMEDWPTQRLRVADRGLREGLLIGLLKEAGEGRAVLKSPSHPAPGPVPHVVNDAGDTLIADASTSSA